MPQEAGKEILLHILRKYRVGSEIEESFDMVGESPAAQQQAQEQQKQIEEQGRQVQEAMGQLKQQQAQFKAEVDGANANLKAERATLQAQQQAQTAEMKASQDIYEAEFKAMVREVMADFNADQKIAQSDAKSAIQRIQTAVEQFMGKLEVPAQKAKEEKDAQTLQGMAQANNEVRRIAAEAIEALQAAAMPKNVEVVRDPQTGRAMQLKVVPVNTNGGITQ